MRSAARDKARVPDWCRVIIPSRRLMPLTPLAAPVRADAIVRASGQDAGSILCSKCERFVIARRWSGQTHLGGHPPTAFPPRKFIAFSATKFKHAAFVGLPAVILALGAVD
jgi:hypothetical protein